MRFYAYLFKPVPYEVKNCEKQKSLNVCWFLQHLDAILDFKVSSYKTELDSIRSLEKFFWILNASGTAPVKKSRVGSRGGREEEEERFL